MVRFLLEASGKNTEAAWSFNAALGQAVPQFQSNTTNCAMSGKPLDLSKL